jgi:hypothetical protein
LAALGFQFQDQKLVKSVIGDVGEQVGEPSLRIDVVGLAVYSARRTMPNRLVFPRFEVAGIVRSVPPLSTARMDAQDYLGRSRLFRRLKTGLHGQSSTTRRVSSKAPRSSRHLTVP